MKALEIILFVTDIIIFFYIVKVGVLGSEFRFRKWYKRGREYIKDYEEWMEKRP